MPLVCSCFGYLHSQAKFYKTNLLIYSQVVYKCVLTDTPASTKPPSKIVYELNIDFSSTYVNHKYLSYFSFRGFTYYKMSNLDSRIANADQLLTTDVEKFCDMVTDLYSNICKPMLDIIIYVYQLSTNIGGTTPAIMMAYLAVAGTVLTWLRRPVGRMTVTEQKLEGEFRYINSRLISNSEEIAFYNGNNREKLTVLTAFQKLVSFLSALIYQQNDFKGEKSITINIR